MPRVNHHMKTRWITALLIGSAFAAGYAVNAHAYAAKEFSEIGRAHV